MGGTVAFIKRKNRSLTNASRRTIKLGHIVETTSPWNSPVSD